MHKNPKCEEALLAAWMEMALNIRGNRIVDGLSFNEIVICSLLYRNRKFGDVQLTATDIGEYTRLLKSQLNKVLTGMEEKGLITRTRSKQDKRKVFVALREENLYIYLDAHEKVMELVHEICEELGAEQTELLTKLLIKVVDTVNRRL